ncbi:hypothetical protein P691DRAFT_659231, partial [Macrolepiota fuliginosa MF-IS2]
YVGFAGFTILIWDHIVTFADEVEYVWKRRKGPVTYLFLLNRYLMPLGFIVNLMAYLSPLWTTEVRGDQNYPLCNRFIRYEGAMTVIGVSIVALMMYLRIYVLYNSKYGVLFGVGFILLAQISVNAWLLTRGEAVLHNPASGIKSCTMIFDPSISVIASSSAWLPLLYDTIVFILVAYKTIPNLRGRMTVGSTMTRLLEDGSIYYTVICTVTLVLTLMIVFAQPGLKNIVAQYVPFQVTMMSRITLSLKKSVSRAHTADPDVHLVQSIVFARARYVARTPTASPRLPEQIPRHYTPTLVETDGDGANPPRMTSRDAALEDGRLDLSERQRPQQ